MITYTEDDLRAALHVGAAETAPSPEVWHRVRKRITRRRRVRFGAAALAAALTIAVSLGIITAPGSGQIRRSSLLPTSYQQACANEPNVCRSGTTGTVPSALGRPLRLRRLDAGDACPASRGVIGTSTVIGQQYGDGPIQMVLGDAGDPSRGITELGNPDRPGWLAAENVWRADPSYDGPFSVRGMRLDAAGTVLFGDDAQHLTPTFVEPPGPDRNMHDGVRTPPASIWVRSPGCYGFQIDGLSFSETVVLDMVRPATVTPTPAP